MGGSENDGTHIGDIRLLQRIGHGSMGVVYRGFHEKLGHEVAIKLLSHRQDSTQKRLVERFKREGEAASTIRHPNVVRFYGSGLHNQRPYIIMEFVNGASLGNVLDEKERLNPAHVVPMAIAIAEGLAAIHRTGIIHRDIKPDNILLGAGAMVKITDLGLARYVNDPELNRLTATGVVVGTPLYVAPEAIKDTRNTGPAADMYSLGATLYHMASGRPPFDADSPYELMRMHLDLPPRPLSELVEGIPRYVEEAILACLAKNPGDRPSATKLIGLLRGQRSLQRGGRFIRNLVLITVTVILILAVVVWFLLAPGMRPPAILVVDNPDPSMEVSIDGGEARRATTLTLPPGERQVRISMHRPDGRLLVWSGPVELNADHRTTVTPALPPVPVGHRIDEIPGEGLVFRQGRPAGLIPPLVFEFAGRYHLARWNGLEAVNATVVVDAAGVHLSGPWRRAPVPSDAAYFVPASNGLPPYHVVTWKEILYAATAAEHAGLRRLALHADDPCTPATDLSADTVSSWCSWRQPLGARLADREEAGTLSEHLQRAIWYRGASGLDTFAGPRYDRVLLVALPGDEKR